MLDSERFKTSLIFQAFFQFVHASDCKNMYNAARSVLSKMGPAPRPLGSWILGTSPLRHLGTVLHLRVLINHPAMSAIGKPDIEPTPPNDRPLTASGIRKRSRDLCIGLSR